MVYVCGVWYVGWGGGHVCVCGVYMSQSILSVYVHHSILQRGRTTEIHYSKC